LAGGTPAPRDEVIMQLLIISLTMLLLLSDGASADSNARPRLLILTDIGGDPDDQQSMIRLMHYSNEFELEGLIASASGTPGELKKAVTRPELIREIVDAYGQVRENLSLHAEGYPAVEQLRKLIKSGNSQRGLEAIGKDKTTEGSEWIIRAADRDDERPLNIAIWGGQTDLAQALWHVRDSRGEEGLRKFMAKLRVYDIDDQDRIQSWIFENFPDLFYVLAKSSPGRDKREGAYRGMYLDGDESLTSLDWINAHLRQQHGPLGALYPTKTWTAPNPNSALKEGDTPSWFYFLPHGVNDPAHPDWGSWGGRFQKAQRGLWRDAADQVGREKSARATVWRWRPMFQSDLQARADWCVKSRAEANHAPLVAIDGDRSRAPLQREVQSGSRVTLDAKGSTDPDDHRLTYRWWQYSEPGSYPHMLLGDAEQPLLSLDIPADAAEKTVHVVLEITDDGVPPLTSLRRVVLQVK